MERYCEDSNVDNKDKDKESLTNYCKQNNIDRPIKVH